ncbi:MAG: hypothetical protein HY900_22395, partial [Deltaproteobacteria bacterium]|nr:hypothetical protein [Deltaproteobacteria bacterium]
MGNLFSHLFYLFLTSPVLSPAVNSTSVYLFLVIPLVDPEFLRYLKNKRINPNFLFAALLLLTASIPYASLHFGLKVVSIVVTVTYMQYTLQTGRFHLYKYINLNVAVALVQVIGLLVFQRGWLFPFDIGTALWGKYALLTGPTPAEAEGILLAFRFSGLSREPGFFASLVIASFLLLLDHRTVPRRKLHLLVHTIGIVVSFSKISLAFFAVFPFVFFSRRLVEKVPKSLVVGGVLAAMVAATLYVYDHYGVDYVNQSFQHRTFGYALLRELSTLDLLCGVGFRNVVSRAGQIPLIMHSSMYERFPDMIAGGSGLASIIVDHGVLFFLMLVFLLYLVEANAYELLLFLLMS